MRNKKRTVTMQNVAKKAKSDLAGETDDHILAVIQDLILTTNLMG